MPSDGRDTSAYLVSLVEMWQRERVRQSEGFNLRGFREFCEVMNKQTRDLISFCDRKDPEFWTALLELAQNASTLTTKGAKVRADHRDVTNL